METVSIAGFRSKSFSTVRRVPILAVILLSNLVIGSSFAATITWTGAVSTDWNNATNWSPQQVPTSVDTSVINSGTVVASSNAQFSTLTFNGGTLGGPVLVRSNCVMNWNNGILAGGSLTVESNAVVNLLTSGAKYLDAPMTNSGSVQLTTGTFYVRNNNSGSLGRVVNRGLWQLQGDLDLNQWFGSAFEVFVNNGTFRKSSGSAASSFSVALQNQFGVVEVQSGTLRFERGQQLDGLFMAAAGAVIQFNAGISTYTALTQLTGAGQYQLTGGTLQGLLDYLPNLQLLGGSVQLSPSYQTNGLIVRLDLNGANLLGSNRVSGVLNLNSGSLAGPVTLSSNAVLNWSSGTINSTSSLVVESNAAVNLMTSGSKYVDGAMVNSGTVIWTGGTFYVRNNNNGNLGNVVNLGLWQMQGDLDLAQWFGTGFEKLINGGTFRKASGSGVSTTSLIFINEFGNVEVLSGVFRFDRGTQLDGLFLATLGAAIQFNNGTFNYTSLTRLTGAGQYQLIGGTLQGLLDYLPNLQLLAGSVLLGPTYQTNGTIVRLDLNGATLVSSNRVSGVLNLFSGRVAGSLVVGSNAALNWYGGRFDGPGLTIESNGVANLLGSSQKDLAGCLTNAGQVVWSAGTITVFNNASTLFGAVENQPGGSWDVQGDLTMNQSPANNYAAFRNRGLLKKSAGAGTASLDLPFYNLGILKQLSGILDFGRDLSLYSGTVVFGIASNGFGRINLLGTASLGGNLGVELLGGFIPVSNATYQVMSYGISASTFTNYDGLNVGFGRYFTPVYTATTLTLQASGTNGPNSAPSLSPISNVAIIERTTLAFTNSANDPNGDQIQFNLVSAPTNATLGLTTGIFSWTPTEAQGNTTNLITLRAFDNGSPSLSATQSFTVTVIKTNHVPVLPQIAPQLIGVGGTLTVTNIAVDVDTPTNLLTYALLGAPLGVAINNGIITWSPSNSGSFQITTRVTDNGAPALSATNTFAVSVLSKPVPPSGLVSYWTGDGTTGDQNGLNDGALAGSASYAPGLYGQAFNFTGGSLAVLNSASLSFGPTNALSVEMWVKRTQTSPGYPVYYFGKRVNCGVYNYQSPSDQISGGVYDPPVGEWRHFAWVFTGTEWLGYVNGVLVHRTQTSLGASNSASLFIGASGTCASAFPGLIDEARIYNRALTSNEVAAVYAGSALGPPIISRQPLSQKVAAGTTAVLTGSAYGVAPISYQWRFNGSPINGQTASTLTLNNINLGQSGIYDLVASNALGTATSLPAELAVLQAPAISVQPVGLTAAVGSNVTLTVVATGTPTPAPTLSYQWRKGGIPIGGALGSTLALNNVQVSDAGNYDVIVANWVGSVTSVVATVSISTPIVWTGTLSTDWNNATNWSPQQVPTSTDTAVINSGTVIVATNAQFRALTFNGGTLSGPVLVRSNCVMNWNDGLLINGSLTVQSNAVVNLQTSAAKYLDGPMTNSGSVLWTGGTFYVRNNNSGNLGRVVNRGLWQMQGDLDLSQWFGTGFEEFENNGTFRKSNGTGVSVFSVVLQNQLGVVEVQSGTLRFERGQQLDGVFIAAAGAVVQFNAGTSIYTALTQLTGAGQYQLTGGTLQGLPDYLPNLQLLGGSVQLSPTFQTNGLIVRLDLNGANLLGNNRVSGVLNLNSGSVSGPLTIASNAVVNWSSGTFNSTSSLVVESNAVVNLITSGGKYLDGPMLNSGEVIWTAGTFYIRNNNSGNLGSVVNLGLWQMQGDLDLAQWFGTGFEKFINGGTFRKAIGSGISTISVILLNEFGNVEVQSGILRFDRGMALDGLFIAGLGATIQFNTGTFSYTSLTRLTGAGQFQLTGGTLQGLPDYVSNLQLLGGSVSLSPTYQTNGPIVRLDLNGATLAGSNYVVGVLNLNSGSLVGSVTIASNAVFNWRDGLVGAAGSLTVQSNGVANLLTSGAKYLDGRMTNSGTVIWTGGTVYIRNNNSGNLGNVVNSGVWQMQGDLDLNQWFGNNLEIFNNSGTFRKSSGTGTGSITITFQNQSGVIDVQTGLLSFNRPITFAGGGVSFGISSNGFGRIAVSGAATLTGSIAASLRDGFIPATNASYQVMTFTSASGSFTNTSGLNVGFGRSFTPAYAATTLTLQAAVTNAPNNTPTLAAISNVTITEGTTYTLTNSASDPDGDQILFGLVTAPTNATLGLTTGIFSWTPTETQGNTTNLITLRAFDSGSPSLSATQSFTIIVAKSNSSPALAQIGPQLIGVGGTLIVTNSAFDPDVPANTLTYSLLSPPPGVTVSTNGVITWSPTNPGSYTVTMRVTDNGVPALSATNSFIVSVIPKPLPPAGLISWWTGDGTTADAQGTNHGVLSGNAAYAAGLYGQAFSFTGGWLTVLHSASLSFAPGSAMSFELWAKRTQAGYPVYYFGKRVGCGASNYQSPSDQISGGAYDPPVGQWRHFVWVYTGTEWLGYVNGGLVYHTEATLGPENLAALFIGNSGTCGQSFVGLIDEARIYNRALSSGEITALYSGQDYGPPIISQQPQSKWVVGGTTAVLNSGAYGLAPLSYQWRFNGAPVAGQTSPTLTLNNVSTAQSGNYDLFVTNALGTAVSQVAGLSVIQAPAIITQPQSQATIVSANVDLVVEATGTPTPTLSYQWRKGGIPIGGAIGSTLSLNNVQIADAGNYDVIVANWAGSVTSAVATVNVAIPITWTGLVSSDWHNATNWNPQQVPTSVDTAVINSGTVQLTTNAQFFALIFNGGTLSGSVLVRSNRVMNWNSGALSASGSLTVESNAVVRLQTANIKDLNGPMTNSGTVLWTGGTFTIRNNNSGNLGRVVNRGLWQMLGDLNLAQAFGTGFEIFVNNGTFRKSSGTGIGIFGVVLQNQFGVVDVQSGVLRFDRGEQLDGMFITSAGAIIQFDGGTSTYTALTQLTGAGQYQLTGGTSQGLLDYLPNLQLLGGSVQLSPSYQTNGLIGRLDLNGASLIGSNRVSGVLNLISGSASGPVTLSSNAVLNWSSGTINPTSTLVVESNAVVNLLTGGAKYLDGSMTNSGSVLWTGGPFYVRNNGSGNLGRVVNRGLWQMQGDLDLNQWFGTGLELFVNTGTFRKSSGAGAGTFTVVLQNQLGLVEVLSGTLRFDRGQQLDGTFFAGPGTVIQFNSGTSTYTALTQFTGTGEYRLTGGTLQGLLDYLPNLKLLGGSVGLSPIYQTNGNIVRLDLDGSTLIGSNVVTGNLNWNSGSLAGSVTIASNAVLNWKDGLVGVGAALTVQSNGVANLLTTGPKYLDGPMTNSGTVLWAGGTIYVRNNNSGNLGRAVNRGLWQMQADLDLNQWFGTGLEFFNNSGTFRKSSGTGIGSISVTFQNQSGTVDVLSGTLRFDRGTQLDGLFSAALGAVIQFNAGTFIYTPLTQLSGAGQHQLIGGTLQGLLNFLPNLKLLGGNVALSPNYQTNGTIVRLDLDGSTLIGSNVVTGVLNLNSGNVAGPTVVTGIGALNWLSGRFGQGASLLLQSNGVANLLGSGQKELGAGMTNFGRVYWSGGNISIMNDASTYLGAVENQPSGLWEVQGDLSLVQWVVNNFAYFRNSGMLRKSVGAGTATIDVVFSNQGVIEQLSGIWTFGRNFSLTEGTVLFGIAGDSNFGRINLTGTASLAGKLAARLLNGYVPATNRTFQVMSYGVVAGTFTDYSGLDVGSGRAFLPVYTPTSLTLQTYATNSTVNPTPIILSNPTKELSGFSFLFTGDPGTTYTVQYATNLSQPVVWSTLLVTNIPVSPAKVTDPAPAIRNRFYRVSRSAIVSTPIVLSNPKRESNQFTFLFTGDTGVNYTVQFCTNLNQNIWSTLLVTNIPVSPAKVTDPNPSAQGRFYRVVR